MMIKRLDMAPATAVTASMIDEASLTEGLQEVLSATLVGVTPQAQEVVPDVARATEGEAGQADSAALLIFAAALGTTAAGALSHALIQWLNRRRDRLSEVSLPNWLRPAVSLTARPLVATLTDFANNRSRYVRSVESGEPVLISRHGTVVAALIPVEVGAYEEAVYPEAARRRRAERLQRRSQAERPSELNDEQLQEIEASGSSSTASRYGIDTTGWELLNPPASAEH
jgi:prevent-host-death family protein